jgi:hypothetical protein
MLTNGTTLGSSRPRAAVRVGKQQVEEILDDLDRSESVASREARRYPRYRWRSDNLVVFVPQEGVETPYQAPTRNISIGGISILIGFMLTTGQNVRIRFRQQGWRKKDISARVCHCRRVVGSIHEVGIRYVVPGMGEELLAILMQSGHLEEE